jgi:hypothetical protein
MKRRAATGELRLSSNQQVSNSVATAQATFTFGPPENGALLRIRVILAGRARASIRHDCL